MTETEAQKGPPIPEDASLPQDVSPLVCPANDEPEPPDEQDEDCTYVAIEGVSPEDFSTDEEERLEVSIINTLLTELGKPITDVRVIGDDVAVAEMEIIDD